MKICFITTFFDTYRGGNSLFLDLFQKIKGENKITVITAKSSKIESGLIDIINIPVGLSSRLYFYNDRLFSKKVFEEVSKISKENPFDLIIINQVAGKSILKFKNIDTPILYIIHHPFSVDLSVSLSESKSLFERLKWKIKYWGMVSIQKKIVQVFDNISTVSESSKERIADDYNIAPDKIKVVYNGVDTDFFKNTGEATSKTVMTLGSYQHPRRGFKYLFEIYIKLSKRGYKIIDIGRRTDQQGEVLKKIENLETLGIVDQKILPDLYSKSSVFLSTSLFEGFGLTATEALSCQTPVVAFSGGGINDVLKKVDLDMLCDPKDIDEFVRKVEKFNSISKQEKENYRIKIKENFSINRMVDDYKKLFESIISDN